MISFSAYLFLFWGLPSGAQGAPPSIKTILFKERTRYVCFGIKDLCVRVCARVHAFNWNKKKSQTVFSRIREGLFCLHLCFEERKAIYCKDVNVGLNLRI